MMRLLVLCLLLLPVTTAVSEDNEGSADEDGDDEDYKETVVPGVRGVKPPDTLADKTTGTEETSDQFILIVVVVAVTALTLSVAAIVTIMLVRRHMKNQQQGIYTVPIEQHHKGV